MPEISPYAAVEHIVQQRFVLHQGEHFVKLGASPHGQHQVFFPPGRVFFLTIDAVCLLLFKKKIPEKYQAAVNGACFVALMAFMLMITFNDVFKLFR